MSGNGDGSVKPCCERCRFSRAVELTGPQAVELLGTKLPMLCRRFPPQLTMTEVKDSLTGQSMLIPGVSDPPVTADHWCGEYRAILDIKTA